MAPTGLKRSRSGEGQNVVLASVAAFFGIMALGAAIHGTSPIVTIFDGRSPENPFFSDSRG
jgi:hypothetical protein